MEDTIAKVAQINFADTKPRYRPHREIGIILKSFVELYPGMASLKSIGRSLEGLEIFCLSLGDSDAKNRVLMLANAHGEEMRGTEEILHVVQALLKNEFLQRTFLQDFHFTVIPTINPDAREYNLRWAATPLSGTKDEIDLKEYFLAARRQVDDKDGINADMEWGYPLSDKDARTMRRPEQAALKQLMDNEKFDLYLDLHGALNVYDVGFWFLHGSGQKNRPATIEFLHSTGLQSGLPLVELEKMEGDLCLKIKPGVHTLCTAKEILAKLEKEPKLAEHFKKEYGASSFDYLLMKNPDAQCFVAELPTYYHERFMDMTPSGILRKDLRKRMLEKSTKRVNEILIPLLDEALGLSDNPILKRRREDIDNITIPSINNSLSRLEEEHGESVATLGEVRNFEELSEYWQCPGYGRHGIAEVINRLPADERMKLADIYKRCEIQAEKCARVVRAAGLRELSFADSVNLQARTCLGLVLTYFG